MSESTGGDLTPADKAFLRELASRAVAAAATGLPAPDPDRVAADTGFVIGPALRRERGAFVTLTSGGQLRGCIGSIEGFEPLVQAVVENAANAAVGDPRFEPVGAGELGHLELEISALTPLTPVPGPEAIEIGRHGIVLEHSGRRSVFLPQVASEQGWDLETTLDHLSLKAGLGRDAWRQGARFQVFAAEVF
ncbi:MAG: AmmeMemoRadiSam system protein A [bacterium]